MDWRFNGINNQMIYLQATSTVLVNQDVITAFVYAPIVGVLLYIAVKLVSHFKW